MSSNHFFRRVASGAPRFSFDVSAPGHPRSGVQFGQ